MKNFAGVRWHHGGILLAGCAALALADHRPAEAPADPPEQITPGDLCRATFASRRLGHRVRVPFCWPLVPTADPRVWYYHPGHPPELVAPTVRLEFDQPPGPLPGPLTIIKGVVARIDPDDHPRLSGNLGVVVLTACRLAPAGGP